jgi:enterochelin esterase-like enzyme
VRKIWTVLTMTALLAGCGAAAPADPAGSEAESGESRLEEVSYSVEYDGTVYAKTAAVYVPEDFTGREPVNVWVLMHGSGGSGADLAQSLKPLLDEELAERDGDPLLVVFPTYYPDRTFVTSSYPRDYPLNHFFGGQEVVALQEALKQAYPVGSDRGRWAFGGYSMGGVTTWEVLAYHPEAFAWFVPMAGDCWIDGAEEVSGDAAIADLLVRRVQAAGYGAGDIHILAMCGGADGTRLAMQPQIAALRSHPELFDEDDLQYWENAGGGHNGASLEAEVRRALSWLFV